MTSPGLASQVPGRSLYSGRSHLPQHQRHRPQRLLLAPCTYGFSIHDRLKAPTTHYTHPFLIKEKTKLLLWYSKTSPFAFSLLISVLLPERPLVPSYPCFYHMGTGDGSSVIFVSPVTFRRYYSFQIPQTWGFLKRFILLSFSV